MNLDVFKDVYNQNSPFLKEINVTLDTLEEGYAKGTLVLTDKVANINRTVHGGVLFSFADAISGAAAKSYGNATTTLEGKMNYIKAGKLDDRYLTAEARVIHPGKSAIIVECRIYNSERALLTVALFTMYRLDGPAM